MSEPTPFGEFQPPDPLTTEEAAELANVLPPTLEDAYAEGRADEREALADPLHANAVYRVKKQADADGLDIVGFAWRLQKEWLGGL
jgi:hypothetical protein